LAAWQIAKLLNFYVVILLNCQIAKLLSGSASLPIPAWYSISFMHVLGSLSSQAEIQRNFLAILEMILLISSLPLDKME
jgi:hypothetical protein